MEWPVDERIVQTECRIDYVASFSTTWGIDLECADASDAGDAGKIRRITLVSDPSSDISWWEGTKVTLTYTGGAGSWLVLRAADNGMVLLAATVSTSLAPPSVTPSDWYAPLGVAMVEGLCPLTPFCGQLERVALDLTQGMSQMRVFEGQAKDFGTVPTYLVFARTAFVIHDLSYEGVSATQLRLLIVARSRG